MLTQKEAMLLDALAPRAEENGMEIVTVEIVGSRKAPTICVYIDTEHGVGFDELSEAQVWVNEIVEAIDPFPGAYTLEVSSPGIDRPLRTPAHFNKQAGGTAVVKTRPAVNGRTNFTATIVSATEETLTLEDEGTGEQIAIPFDCIKTAHLKGVIDFSKSNEKTE